jgi:hypothetical protein
MTVWIPEIGDVVTAVIGIACRGGEHLRIPKVYSALRELKGGNAILSGLYFSITGAVCYSRQVDAALRSLVARGMLVLTERDTVIVRGEAAREIRARLRKSLPSSVYRSLRTASRRFYGKMTRIAESSRPPD